MKLEDCTPGKPVSFYNYMATVEQYTQMALVFGRIVSAGKQRVTIVNEWGRRQWMYPYDLSYAPEGEEILKKKGV